MAQRVIAFVNANLLPSIKVPFQPHHSARHGISSFKVEIHKFRQSYQSLNTSSISSVPFPSLLAIKYPFKMICTFWTFVNTPTKIKSCQFSILWFLVWIMNLNFLLGYNDRISSLIYWEILKTSMFFIFLCHLWDFSESAFSIWISYCSKGTTLKFYMLLNIFQIFNTWCNKWTSTKRGGFAICWLCKRFNTSFKRYVFSFFPRNAAIQNASQCRPIL